MIHEAAGKGERKGAENLGNTIQGSGEDYAKRVLEFLEAAREEKMKRSNGTCALQYSSQQKRRRKQRRAKEGKKVKP